MLNILESDNVISNEMVDQSRWSIHHEIIFKYGDKFYRTHYRVGATEYQEESPWEYDDFVNVTEVVPQEKVVTVYVDAE